MNVYLIGNQNVSIKKKIENKKIFSSKVIVLPSLTVRGLSLLILLFEDGRIGGNLSVCISIYSFNSCRHSQCFFSTYIKTIFYLYKIFFCFTTQPSPLLFYIYFFKINIKYICSTKQKKRSQFVFLYCMK
jgi:hypothetical protein